MRFRVMSLHGRFPTTKYRIDAFSLTKAFYLNAKMVGKRT